MVINMLCEALKYHRVIVKIQYLCREKIEEEKCKICVFLLPQKDF